MKNKTLYVNGCSFAYGMGVNISERETWKERFSATLSTKIGYEDLNKSVPGSCNQRIARRTALDLISLKPDIAIIVWSDPARFEFVQPHPDRYRFGEDCEQVRPLSIYNYPRNKKHAFLDYYNHIASSHTDMFNTLYAMLSTKMIADSLKIPCIQIPFKNAFHRELLKVSGFDNQEYLDSLNQFIDILSSDDLIFGINDEVSFDSISGCDRDKSLLSGIPDQGGHPGKAAHDIMSNWLYKFITDKNLL